MKLKLSFKRGTSTRSVVVFVGHVDFKAFLRFSIEEALHHSVCRDLLNRGYKLYAIREIL